MDKLEFLTTLGLVVQLDQMITDKLIALGHKLDYIRDLNPTWTKEEIEKESDVLTGKIASLTEILMELDNLKKEGK